MPRLPKAEPYGRMVLKSGREVYYRPGSTDENVLTEVLVRRAYRRAGINLDVKEGERWLDLGANIGAFAVYCLERGAEVDCYEPDPDCVRLLRLNAPEPEARIFHAAVTHLEQETVSFWPDRGDGRHARGSTYKYVRSMRGTGEPLTMPNFYAGYLEAGYEDKDSPVCYDGIKMDIEGAEMGILDAGLLPRCRKLVLEYHLSRDKSVKGLARRLKMLKARFRQVAYTPGVDRVIASGVDQKMFVDPIIYCAGGRV